ncbi:hypothetical protein [Schaalia sp. lx-260]|uniref:hypothetical protein n=1 Tax=Schaalia sp. lx-260 TaxID=2899082 RepID=UPI001E50C041|nr:hypothetical protein [Schaalia sp. lx-260]MCD4549205.1 hypothetical protein [Schaalia sp. lx-260]
MTNAPDRTRVPKLSVPFMLGEIPQEKEEECGIGKSIGSAQGIDAGYLLNELSSSCENLDSYSISCSVVALFF